MIAASAPVLTGSYNYQLVALSVFIAILASYAALDLAGRVTSAQGAARLAWLSGGATAMGLGIWSMHYIGMLAFQLPVPVSYHWPTVLLSLLAAVFASAVALFVVSRQRMGPLAVFLGSISMGCGIAAMHYIGMAAMRLPAVCGYSSGLVTLSIFLAILISFVALWLTFHFRGETSGWSWRKTSSALVMGAAIPIMHYTGMAAARFTFSTADLDLAHAVSISSLGIAGISAITLMVLGLAILTSLLDRTFSAQSLELASSEQRYRQLVESAQVILWRRDIQTLKFNFVSKEAEPLVGYPAERWVNDPLFWANHVHPEDLALADSCCAKAIQEHSSQTFEHRMLASVNRILWLRTSVRVAAAGKGKNELMGAMVDITERKQAEAGLRESEERVRLLLDSTAEAIYGIDLDGLCSLCNPACLRLLGYDGPAGLLGKNIHALMHHTRSDGRPYPAVECRIHQAFQIGEGAHVDDEVLWRKDGSSFPVEHWSHPMRRDGKVIGAVVTFLDITERKRAEEALARAKDNLEIKVALRTAELARTNRQLEQELVVRKEAEAALEGARDRYRFLAETIPQIVWTARPDGWLDYYNQRWFEYTGLTQKQTEGWGWGPVVHPDDLPNCLDSWDRAVRTGDPYEIEYRFRRGSDGAYRWHLGRAVPQRDVLGNIVKWFGTSTDIDDKKTAEVALLAARSELEERVRERTVALYGANAQLKNVLDAATLVSIISTDPQGLITTFNSGAERMLGYTAEEMVGKQSPAIIHLASELEAYSHDLTEQFQRPIRGFDVFFEKARQGKHDEREWTYVRKDGTHLTVDVVVTAIRSAEGEISGFLGMAKDVTERKRAEQSLRESEDRFRKLSECSPVGIFQTDARGQILYANSRWQEIGGLTVAETLEEENGNEILSSGRKSTLRAETGRVRTATPFAKEFCLVTPDGRVRWVRSQTAPILTESGEVAGYVGTTEDMTERKKSEAEIQKAREAAEKATRTKSEFLANMSHEIRTPMNGIIGMAELALETDLSDEQREYLSMVKTSADSLLSLINDILDFSKIEAGKLDIEAIAFSLRDTLDDTMKILSLRAGQKGLELACHVLPDVPDSVIGDPTRLRQIVINLVGNAIKFTAKGEVLVRVETETEDEDQAILHLSVRDTGVGIPQEKQQAIFQAFSQVDSSTMRKYGGTGLGLSISSRLVELMGGRIWVESEPGQGSTFHFNLHFGLQKISLPAPVTVESTMLRDLAALIVDHSATSSRILEEMLLSWEMKPLVVNDGRRALEILEQARKDGKPFRLVLLDTQMPEMNSFQFAQKIRQGEQPHESIIMLTLAGIRGDAARCREFGIQAYLTKPVKRSDLLDAIKAIVGAQVQNGEEPPLVTHHSLRESRGCWRVLLAEDNAVNRVLAIRLLEKRGYTVVVAETGKGALQAFEGNRFDLILMDVQMPEMDGFEVTAHIRELEKSTGKHIPIIAMTAHAMTGHKEHCLASGMDAYVSKPLQIKELFAVIENQLIPPPSTPVTPEESMADPSMKI
jgi:two-component system sensor histidine kinase/response regulator